MPYQSVSDVPDYVPADKKKQWMEVWNSAHKKAKADGLSDKDAEAKAFKIANGVVKKEKNSVREFRFINAEMRAEQEGDKHFITGYAAVFNSESEVLGGFLPFREVIRPGAFDRALKSNPDVRMLINHDPSLILGRTTSGTLTLRQDEKGLHFRCEMPNTGYARDLREVIMRGDMSHCSFGFSVDEDGQHWIDSEKKTEPATRELLSIENIFDTSVVTYPAYTSTTVAARQLFPDGIPAEVRNRLEEDDADYLRKRLARFNEKKRADGEWEKLARAAIKAGIKLDEEHDIKWQSRITKEQRTAMEDMCECDCPECEAGDCENCSDAECDDPNCEGHAARSIAQQQDKERAIARAKAILAEV